MTVTTNDTIKNVLQDAISYKLHLLKYQVGDRVEYLPDLLQELVKKVEAIDSKMKSDNFDFTPDEQGILRSSVLGYVHKHPMRKTKEVRKWYIDMCNTAKNRGEVVFNSGVI